MYDHVKVKVQMGRVKISGNLISIDLTTTALSPFC